ncbi:hypothetical protein B0T19DRAFT_148862 [Cercophora scortea]|uniref:Very long-chain fatty acid transport protein n=1 Tax=Cercophora scortea TaxID=314031 RepID=A0AAE0IKX9_9PEZI|nr:hypothetical protein B0T19DRAFT_148862 [Cercophora scortea]
MPPLPLPLPVALPLAAASAAYLSARLSLAQDLLFLRITTSALINVVRAVRADKISFFYVLEAHARHPSTASSTFLLFEGKSYTYAETYARALQHGTWLHTRHGVRAGDVVAVNFQNSDTFIFLWFGLWAIGARPAFINYNLTGTPLVHSLRESSARLAVVDPRVIGAHGVTDEVRRELEGAVEFVVFDEGVEQEVKATMGVRLPDEARAVESHVGLAILIYTSGTTGLPKPAVVSWTKIYMAAMLSGKGTGMKKGDVFYTSMPLYHSSASCLGVCAALYAGTAIAIGRKFSTKTFWKEVRDMDASIIQYVGETCRYLTVAPPETDPVTGEVLDRKHRVRMAMGNGLRPDVWAKFKDRFNIDTIFEFYAATEAPLATWNLSRNAHSLGAIGRYGLFSRLFVQYRSTIILLSPTTSLPLRDPKTNLCIRAGPNQPGEFLARLPSDDTNSRFQGYYHNDAATNSKILRDVFTKGDAWFRSGDILTWDDDGKIYFSDRIGDTYRWKSENVSTAEVAQEVGSHPAVREANVYGVELPNHDGRAGCVAIAFASPPDESVLRSLADHVDDRLPRYAVPLFLRVVKEVGMQRTGTMKLQKQVLRDQGVHPERVQGDDLFWLSGGTYKPFRAAQWRQLEGGRVKL